MSLQCFVHVLSVEHYVGAAFLFALSQVVYFVLSKMICKGTSAKIDGSFLATLLEVSYLVALNSFLLLDIVVLSLQTGCIGVLYVGWIGITEGTLCGLYNIRYIALENSPYTSFHLIETWDDDYYPT